MAIEVKTQPANLPDTLDCPTRGYIATFYAIATGSSKDPSSIGEHTAEDRAEDQIPALTAAVTAKANQWKPKCAEGCAGHIRIVTGPDHSTFVYAVLDKKKQIIGWEATTVVAVVVSASCTPGSARG